MKIILITFLSLLFFNSVSWSQESVNYIIYYNLSYQYDSTNDKSHNEKMALYVYNNYSYFSSYNHILGDSVQRMIEKNFDPNSGELDLTKYDIPRTNFPFRIIKSPEQIRVYHEHLAIYRYLEDPSSFCWEIQNETITINGLKCQKALVTHGGRNYTAWFTTDIPINSGPYIFTGLPGLIVKIHDDRDHYNFTLLEIKKSTKDLPIEEPQSFQEITKAEFLKMMNDYRRNPIIHIKQYANINLSPEDIRRIKEREKRKNNPIELTAN